jgi:hypothetical protein
MADFEYLDKLPLTDNQRKWFKDHKFKTAACMYCAITFQHLHPRDHVDMLCPLDVDSVRAMLWEMMTPSQQEFYTHDAEGFRWFELIAVTFTGMVGLGFVVWYLFLLIP